MKRLITSLQPAFSACRMKLAALALICGAALSSPPSGLSADLNVPAQYPTIQKAVDAAADGDMIHVAPGVYVEQILILRKKLTLLGRPGAVIRAQVGLTTTLKRNDLPGSGVENTPAVLAAAVSDVVLKGFTFEGEHLGEAFSFSSYMAIVFSGTSGRLEDCTVRGFRNANTLHPFRSFGFAAANWAALGTPPLTVQVLRCAFADNGTSVHVRGDDLAPTQQRLTFTIADNTISGIGPTALGPQAGIEIGVGATGEVRRNTITDHFSTVIGDPASLGSMGIIAVDIWFLFHVVGSPRTLLPVLYENNTFRANQHHLVCLKAKDSQAVNNTFQGAGNGFRPTGIMVSGDNLLISSNRFTDIPTGITLLGNAPVRLWDQNFGTTFGIATNPRLLRNRFCNVTTPVNIEPPASGVTQEGTLVCPFPDPTLEIAPAVILSWPAYSEGWILESAPTVNGPWTALTATATVENDQNTIAVKTESEQRFFRLHKP
ncbi:MAG: hypothetical protein AAB466_08640 [Verrucomicrobiota bacterium]